MSKLHELKTDPDPFQAVWSTRKMFEIRKNDRDFAANDVLQLREWLGYEGYSGRSILVLVVFMLRSDGLEEGFVCMSLKMLARLTGDAEGGDDV